MLGSRVKEPRGDPGLLLDVCPERAPPAGYAGRTRQPGTSPAPASFSANGNFCPCGGGGWGGVGGGVVTGIGRHLFFFPLYHLWAEKL